MNFADQLSDPDRGRYRLSAIKSTLFGCVSEQIIDSNTMLSRLAVTVSLAFGVLIPVWKIGLLEMSKFHFIFLAFLMISIFSLLLLPQTPAATPKHRDYYNP